VGTRPPGRVVLVAVCTTACAVAPALADTMTYVEYVGTNYKYKAEASDASWDVGDIIALSNLDGVTSASEPIGFTLSYTPYNVTWTCVEAIGGPKTVTVQSAVAPGEVTWTILSNDSGGGAITGPEYVPEPGTIALFCGGLVALGGAAWRRRRSASRAPQLL
jgi:hypothetical protein